MFAYWNRVYHETGIMNMGIVYIVCDKKWLCIECRSVCSRHGLMCLQFSPSMDIYISLVFVNAGRMINSKIMRSSMKAHPAISNLSSFRVIWALIASQSTFERKKNSNMQQIIFLLSCCYLYLILYKFFSVLTCDVLGIGLL